MSKHFMSKEEVLSLIKDSNKPMTRRDIAKAFNAKGKDRLILKIMLKQMVNDNILRKERRSGYTLPNNKVQKTKTEQKSNETSQTIIGVISLISDGSGILTPAERGKKIPIQISQKNLNGAKSNDLVVASDNGRYVKISKILGKEDDPKLLSLISIHQQGIPYIFPDNVLKETDSMIVPMDLKNRKDLREIPLVTIDGADARDFDDAVFAEPDTNKNNENGWHLIVAIADVSYYVRQNTQLNEEAYKRGNSTYFPDRVVPMLPEKLSNNLCSLRPNEPRACLAVHLWINEHGELLDYKFIRGLMQSHARLTYEQVEQAYNGNPCNKTKNIFEPIIKPLYLAYEVLKKARNERGSLDIDLPEYQININDKGHIDSISKRSRLQSHQLIEEFMVLANIAAAKALEKNKTTTVYRIHPAPDAAKLAAAHSFFKSIGQNFGKQINATPKDLNNILHKVKNLDIAPLANIIILRSQSKAVYHTENQGHFGLSLTHYTHFTSPIRRYADLLVHRALVKTFKLGEGGQIEDETATMQDMAEHISETERRSMLAERGTMDKYTALYLSEHVGAEFEATINGVNRAGLFIALKDCGSDGFVPARTLPFDQYIHDEQRHSLIGRRTKREFQLCAPIMVKLIEVEPLAGSTVFVLTEHNGKPVPISTQREKRNKNNKHQKHFSKRKSHKRNKRS